MEVAANRLFTKAAHMVPRNTKNHQIKEVISCKSGTQWAVVTAWATGKSHRKSLQRMLQTQQNQHNNPVVQLHQLKKNWGNYQLSAWYRMGVRDTEIKPSNPLKKQFIVWPVWDSSWKAQFIWKLCWLVGSGACRKTEFRLSRDCREKLLTSSLQEVLERGCPVRRE